MEYWLLANGILAAGQWNTGCWPMEYWLLANGILAAGQWNTGCWPMEYWLLANRILVAGQWKMAGPNEWTFSYISKVNQTDIDCLLIVLHFDMYN